MQHNIPPSEGQSSAASPDTSGFDQLSQQLDHWRSHLNQYQHPVMLFDANFWPVLLNKTLRGLVDTHTLVPGTDLTVSCMWQTGCETAGRIAADHAQSHRAEIAEVFPLYERCFVTVGSLLQSPSGRIAGAIVSLAQLTVTAGRMETLLAENHGHQNGAGTTDHKADFEGWKIQRSEAQQRIQKLSRRESQVAAYVSEGWASKCIASELGVGVKTIEKHRANAILKLGVNSTAEMVRIAAVAGHTIPKPDDAESDETPSDS